MWRRYRANALLGAALVLLLAACAPSTGGGGAATPTPTPLRACATWQIVSSPAAAQYPWSQLDGVTALTPKDAWAVGVSAVGEGSSLSASLIERWDGAAWSLVANPGEGSLKSIAAVSAQDVWAVGVEQSRVSSASQIFIEHWNGTRWSIVSAPIPGQTNSGLNSVAAQSASSVWAAGYYNGLGFNPQPLIERWNGATWEVSLSALPATASAGSFNALGAVPGSSQVWAVGAIRYGPAPERGLGYFQPLIERWSGSAWQTVAAPTLPAGALAGTLFSVSARSATDAWAVGNYTASDHTLRALILHWDGTSWKVSPSPDTWGELMGVAVASAQDASAVGYSMTGAEGSAQIGLVERWNGSAWTALQSPTPHGEPHSSLAAIATDGAGGYWATGWYPNADSVSQSFVARCS